MNMYSCIQYMSVPFNISNYGLLDKSIGKALDSGISNGLASEITENIDKNENPHSSIPIPIQSGLASVAGASTAAIGKIGYSAVKQTIRKGLLNPETIKNYLRI